MDICIIKVNVKVKSLCFNWAPCHAFLTLAVDGDECSAWQPGHFTPRERDPGTH